MRGLQYFAYGSNLCRAIFVERRGMRPNGIRVARLAGYRLCFDIPVGSGERAVANLRLDAASGVWGVAYEISAAEFDHLDRTEGVPQGVYKRTAVEVESGEAELLAAFTYVSAISVSGRKPSPRYIGLLLAGARENALPREYVDYLEAIELGRDERQQSPTGAS